MKKIMGKKAAIILGACGLALILAACVLRYTDSERSFLKRTSFSGVDCTAYSEPGATARVRLAAEQYTLTVADETGETLVSLKLAELIDWERYAHAVNAAFGEQHAACRGLQRLGAHEFAYAPELATYDAATLTDTLEEAIYAEREKTAPVSAVLVLAPDGYRLQSEERGFTVDAAVCAEAISAAVAEAGTLRDITLTLPEARLRPERTGESTILRHKAERLEKYLSPEISVDFGNGNVIAIDRETIYAVSDFTETVTTVRCVPNMERIAALTEELCAEYADDGVYAKFRNAQKTRELIYYRVGDDGWRLQKDVLAQELYNAILSGEDAVLTPTYDYTWYWHEVYWYNFFADTDTFLEISLDNQYMWYYLDGKLLVETPVVTGCIANESYTRRGFFRINYMVEDTWLVGPTWNDHVDFWMPFDDQIGLHDSSWRDEYGGNIYLTEGSHGCVNTPHDAIETIFRNIWDGVPVIVY